VWFSVQSVAWKAFIQNYALLRHIVAGANITLSDLSDYRVRVYPALAMSLRNGHVIHTLGAPSSGAVLAFMLRVIEGQSNIGHFV